MKYPMSAKWICGVLVVLAALIFMAPVRAKVKRLAASATQTVKGRKTVADRVNEFGEAVDKRLAPRFREAGVPYPPSRITLIGLKHEKLLDLWASTTNGQFRHVKTYPILGASGKLGPKLREGDRQVPEGLYRIESLNPNSSFHLALRINYPNKFDREKAAQEGRTEPGSDIMIHGSTASIGCLAMGDPAAEELFVLAARTGIQNIEVILSPVDFRVRELPPDMPPVPAWMPALYAKIRKEFGRFR